MRRARIKAMATVPVRRKPQQNSVDSTDANDMAVKEKKKEDTSNIDKIEQESIRDTVKVNKQKEQDVPKTDTLKQEKQKEEGIPSISILEQKELNEENILNIDTSKQEVARDVAKMQEEASKKKQNATSLKESEQAAIEKPKLAVVKKSDSQELCSPQKPDSQELRSPQKPNSQALRSPQKPDSQELHSPQKPNSQVLRSPLKPDSQELRSPLKSDSKELDAQAKSNSQESLCTGIKPDKVNVNDDQSVQKSVPLPDVPTVIDIASPTKNRPCFMRPTPRLDSGGRIRKNSVQGSGASASESEDEHSKRAASVVSSRIRNDSICSVQSNKESTTNESHSGSSKFKTTQKRRMLVSESARKLAEARREFLLKHENRTPERSQLKMYDLIYYNPITNPMTKKMSVERRQVPTPQPVEIPEEEDEDDPSAMSTPQVKVGPDGQLIIDEQSLVIEQTDARKEGELMASEATIEDNDTHGGFYKKHKRSKEWPKWETFKFYRVLNVVGTDFLLMQTLFPNRSRQEIKQKYKKEERVNRQLVEKALKFHQEFDTDMLEEQLAMLHKLENIQDTSKRSEKTKSKCMSRTDRKRKYRLVAESIGECEALSNNQEAEDTVVSTTNDEIDIEINSYTSNIEQQVEMRGKARKSKKHSNDKSEKFDNFDSLDFDADSDSSEEVYQPRPTRSGRVSRKIRKLQAPDFNTLNSCIKTEPPTNSKIPSHVAVEVTEYVNTPATNSENMETTTYSNNIINMIPNINQMEPGALVIVSKESTENPGNTILQVYMVASNIDSSTTVTPSTASVAPSSDSSTVKTEDVTEPINAVDENEK